MRTVVYSQNADIPVELKCYSDETFVVRYGKQASERLSYEEAGKELGLCLLHSLACKSGGEL